MIDFVTEALLKYGWLWLIGAGIVCIWLCLIFNDVKKSELARKGRRRTTRGHGRGSSPSAQYRQRSVSPAPPVSP